MKLTHELIEAGMGWNREQLLSIGVGWENGLISPQKGWKEKLIGKEITEEQYEMFLRLREIRKRRERMLLLEDQTQGTLL